MALTPRSPKAPAQLAGLLTPRIDRAARLADEWLERELAALGITVAQFRVIGAMLGDTGGLTQRELAKRLRLDPTTVSVAVSKLESRGYLERTVDASDARARRVRPSTKVPEFATVMARVATLDAVASDGISARDLAVAQRVLARVVQNLHTALHPASETTP
jgi:DNA-binding MarR family transcriptional regulator